MVLLLAIIGIPIVAIAALALWSLSVSRKIDAALPPEGRFVDVAGGRIHYVAMGPEGAPPVVMIHGILAQLRHFSYALAERMANDHRVILIDRPGWGHSTLRGSRPGIAAQADRIAEALGKLGVTKPVIVGHSMGGAVSLALAQRHPDLPLRLALIAPFTQPVDQVVDTFRSLAVPRALAPLIAWTVAVPLGIRTGRKKAAQAFSPDPAPDDFGLKGGGLLALKPASYQSGVSEIHAARAEMTDQARRYGDLGVPVAILYGRSDYLLDPALHGRKTAAAIPGAQLTEIDGGHMLQVCHADATEAWLRGVIGS